MTSRPLLRPDGLARHGSPSWSSSAHLPARHFTPSSPPRSKQDACITHLLSSSPLVGRLGNVGCLRPASCLGCRPSRRLPVLPLRRACRLPRLAGYVGPIGCLGLPDPSLASSRMPFPVGRPRLGLLGHPTSSSTMPSSSSSSAPDLTCDRVDHPPAAIDSIHAVRLT
ncbi:hypothetical protein D1007_02042 [Hordeum vulgare]|nr:hypothetical protein D1007_02042 [Hordeum vulgare]